MLLQQLNRGDAEKVKIAVYNSETSYTIVGNEPVCFDFRATNSLGNAVCSPLTSNLGLFAGIADEDIAAGAFGLAQAYGHRASIRVGVGADSISAAGLVVGLIAGKSSLQSNGRSWGYGPVLLFNNDLSGVNTYSTGFIRLL